jgi:hypothetical protein
VGAAGKTGALMVALFKRWKLEELILHNTYFHQTSPITTTIVSDTMSAVVLPAAFPLIGLGLASTYFLTVSHDSQVWNLNNADVVVVPRK